MRYQKSKVESPAAAGKLRSRALLLMIALGFMLSTFDALAGPTPTPAQILSANSTVRIRWQARPAAEEVTAYNFMEKLSTDYKTLGANLKVTQFDVKLIGTKPRTFAIQCVTDKGPSTITEFVFPGAAAGVKVYVEVQVK